MQNEGKRFERALSDYLRTEDERDRTAYPVTDTMLARVNLAIDGAERMKPAPEVKSTAPADSGFSALIKALRSSWPARAAAVVFSAAVLLIGVALLFKLGLSPDKPSKSVLLVAAGNLRGSTPAQGPLLGEVEMQLMLTGSRKQLLLVESGGRYTSNLDIANTTNRVQHVFPITLSGTTSNGTSLQLVGTLYLNLTTPTPDAIDPDTVKSVRVEGTLTLDGRAAGHRDRIFVRKTERP